MTEQIAQAVPLITQGRLREAADMIAKWRAPEIASLITETDDRNRVELMLALPDAVAHEVFSHLDPETQLTLVRNLDEQEAGRILHSMEPDDLVHFLDVASDEQLPALMHLLDAEDRKLADGCPFLSQGERRPCHVSKILGSTRGKDGGSSA